jgi:two-component system, cell cycle sensor histidine kinase and response regulator CckA
MLAADKVVSRTSPLHVLLVGKREENFFLIREILTRNGSPFQAELDHAATLPEAKAMLPRKSYDLVLFEYETADAVAIDLLSEFLRTGVSVPFIVLAEDADEAAIANILQAGAWDYVDKSQMNGTSLARTIRCALALHSAQRERASAEESVRKLSRAIEQSVDTVLITDREGVIEYVNLAFEALSGYSREEVLGKTPRILKSGEQPPEVYQELWKTILAGNTYRKMLVNRKKNGELYYVEENISPMRDAAGAITHFISSGRDLTDRLRIEAQLLQAQKMDAIGRLAGGVAHDFNNLLTIIMSYSELAKDEVTRGSSLERKLQEILSAARRAAQLTRQLLAFGRKQSQALRVLQLNNVIAEATQTLPRLIGEDIELTVSPGSGLGRVKADPVQIEQMLMDLAAYSRDAMPQGGSLKIETSDVYLDDQYIHRKHAIIPTGHYALITVTDTGVGISPEHLTHIFEPFYTTEPSGQGTGLGLATVYGIVKQNHGFIWAYSELGKGTVFRIYLPCVAGEHTSEAPGRIPEPAARGSEILLLVEDEDAVRAATAEFLRLQGYTVLEAKDGLDALAVAKNHGSSIHLVVTDVVMPNMSGGQLAKQLEGFRPETKILFVSGYAGKTVVDHSVVDLETNFLQKPFSLRQLSAKIREALKGRAFGAKA